MAMYCPAPSPHLLAVLQQQGEQLQRLAQPAQGLGQLGLQGGVGGRLPRQAVAIAAAQVVGGGSGDRGQGAKHDGWHLVHTHTKGFGKQADRPQLDAVTSIQSQQHNRLRLPPARRPTRTHHPSWCASVTAPCATSSLSSGASASARLTSRRKFSVADSASVSAAPAARTKAHSPRWPSSSECSSMSSAGECIEWE